MTFLGSDADAFAGEDGLVVAVKLVAVSAAFDDETVAKMGHLDLLWVKLGPPAMRHPLRPNSV
jgi:hypothetical protein